MISLFDILQKVQCDYCGDPVFRWDNPGDKVLIRIPSPKRPKPEEVFCGTCIEFKCVKKEKKDYILIIDKTGKPPKLYR